MLGKAVLCLSTLQFYSIAAEEQCTDLRGRLISNGHYYVPGLDTCTLCYCNNGLPDCKAVLCSPPQDCTSFRVGKTCCEFICLDDGAKPAESAEANMRMAAGGATVIVLLALAFVVYRVRKQKRRRQPHADDQRSLTSIGYISGSMGYMGSTCETALGGWKPPSNYLPRGEAPPPYDEAVAQCRQDSMRMANESYHRTYPNVDPRNEEMPPCSGHQYAMTRPVTQMANPQNCYNAPLLQQVHQTDAREPVSMPHHPLTPNIVGFPSAIRLTGSLGAISNRGLLSVLQREPDPERPHNVPGFYTNGPNHTSLHRTIPRLAEPGLLDAPLGFGRGRVAHEVRRSFHKAGDARLDAGRSMPRNLNLAAADVPLHDPPGVRLNGGGRSRAHSEEQNVGGAPVGPAPSAPEPPPPANQAPGPSPAPVPAPPTLPLTVDKPSCVCSYDSTAAAGAEDADDYRSECENCKSASSSRWVLEEGYDEEGPGTQTLQRRAPPPAAPAPATATLPQPVTRPTRSVGPPSNWENWFNTIPDSDSESEEE